MDEMVIPRVFSTIVPNSTIELYSGDLRLIWDDNSIDSSGSISLIWSPSPRVAFKFDFPLDSVTPAPELESKVRVELAGHGGHGEGQIWGDQTFSDAGTSGQTLFGTISHVFESGNPAAVDTVEFHVPNFPEFVSTRHQVGSCVCMSRLTTDASEYRIELDGVCHSTQLRNHPAFTGGYGITHTGRIRRKDGLAIAYEDVESLTTSLYWWLSFVRGERTGSILTTGVHEGRAIWERWGCGTIAPWSGRWSWLPLFPPPMSGDPSIGIGVILDHLLQLDKEAVQYRALVRTIDWYTQSASNRHTATTVILAQAGIELMSWLHLVETIGVSDQTFERMHASDKIRVELAQAGIPLGIPSSAGELARIASAGQYGEALDGPAVTVDYRNGVVHPKMQSRFSGAPEAEIQAGSLTIRYLELLLLHAFGYRGSAFDRTDWSKGDVPVPWQGPL